MHLHLEGEEDMEMLAFIMKDDHHQVMLGKYRDQYLHMDGEDFLSRTTEEKGVCHPIEHRGRTPLDLVHQLPTKTVLRRRRTCASEHDGRKRTKFGKKTNIKSQIFVNMIYGNQFAIPIDLHHQVAVN
jgi:hypothetical protein